jgi:hypothetical protein
MHWIGPTLTKRVTNCGLSNSRIRYARNSYFGLIDSHQMPVEVLEEREWRKPSKTDTLEEFQHSGHAYKVSSRPTAEMPSGFIPAFGCAQAKSAVIPAAVSFKRFIAIDQVLNVPVGDDAHTVHRAAPQQPAEELLNYRYTPFGLPQKPVPKRKSLSDATATTEPSLSVEPTGTEKKKKRKRDQKEQK